MDLATRLKSKAMISPAPKGSHGPWPTNDRSICLLSEDEDEDEDDFLSGDEKRSSPKNTETTPSTKPKASKKAKKAAPAKKKAAPKPKKKTVVDLSDSDMSFPGGDSDDSAAEDSSPVAPREQRSRRGAASRKTYAFADSDDDEESDAESEFSFE